MKQGTGKTRVAIELANSTDADLIVFIVPHALKTNLLEEIDKWGLSKDYLIESYQGVSMSDNRYMKLLEKMQDKRCMVIADESMFIKNEQSKTFQRMIKIRDLSEYRLILNGTPISKDEWDLYNQMEFLSPRILKMTRKDFLKTFFTHVKYKRKNEKPKKFYKFSKVNVDYLKRLIEPYTFYVDLDFKLKETNHSIQIQGAVDRQYQLAKNTLLENLALGEDFIVKALRNMEVIIFNDDHRLNEIAKHIKGQCVVFCNFRYEIETLHKLVGGYMIHGGIKNRDTILNEFKKDNQPLFIMSGIGAFGHNLQFCNRVMFSSISFDYSKVEQALYRIKRLGQTKDIEYTYFESNYGIYTMIKENISKKKTLHDLIIEKLGDDRFECI
ncbi:SNF2-related protein [Facklamia sp. P12934]|uniref:SNF2-related protein n=1 Tax=Facklamia sp. P12934 TaxID=3421948 RepID=UPI003D183A7A